MFSYKEIEGTIHDFYSLQLSGITEALSLAHMQELDDPKTGWRESIQLSSLDPRPIRLQLNARSPPRPGIDCIWA